MQKATLLLGLVSILFGSETDKTFSNKEEIVRISEAMGHLIGKNLQALGLSIDNEALVRGIQQASEGKESPLTEEACIQALTALQEESFIKIAQKNLEEANLFLEKNKAKDGIVSLENGKIQYKVEKAGKGEEVQPYSCPLVRYKGSYLNGPLIAETEDLIDIEEAIPGFTKGLVGMKEGESRTLYIHPDFGYGSQTTLHPNTLLIFEVEIVKADATAEAQAISEENQFLKTPDIDIRNVQ